MKDYFRKYRHIYKYTHGDEAEYENMAEKYCTVFAVKVEDNHLSITIDSKEHESYDGRSSLTVDDSNDLKGVFANDINAVLGCFIHDYERDNGEIEVHERTLPCRFCVLERNYDHGRSIYLETDHGDGYPSVELLFEKEYDRIDHMPVYDFFDFCVASGVLTIKDGAYVYVENPNYRDVIETIPPRLTQHEKGWVQPGETSYVLANFLDDVYKTPKPSKQSEQ